MMYSMVNHDQQLSLSMIMLVNNLYVLLEYDRMMKGKLTAAKDFETADGLMKGVGLHEGPLVNWDLASFPG